jgi:hypothetical protein
MSPQVIFHACEPRDEVLQGDLRDEMFAARRSLPFESKGYRLAVR